MHYLSILEEFTKNKKINIKRLDNDNNDYPIYLADKVNILTLLEFLKINNQLRFSILTDLFAADFPNRSNRFEVVYSLLSLKINKRLILKIQVSDQEKIESVAKIYPSACWYEREIFDMYGIEFNNAPDMRRILTDYGFVGHPLRKDFPLTGHLEVTYDQDLEKVIYKPVELEQEFRNFDFTSPWQGPNGVLPGDEKATK